MSLLHIILVSLVSLTLLTTSVAAESDWMLWVTSEETESWMPFLRFRDLAACEHGIRSWIDASEGFWGKGDPSRRRPREDGGYGFWGPVTGGLASGVVEDNRDGAKRRIELLCLPDTAVPQRESKGD